MPAPAPVPVPDSRSARVPFQAARVIFALVVREMGTKFGRSWGGYFWAVAEPLGGVVLLAVAFSLAFRAPPLGSNFALFYATGIVPFFLFSGASGAVAGAITTNRGLLRYPVVRPLHAVLAKFVLEVLTMLVVGVVLTGGIIRIYGLTPNLDLGLALAGFALAGLLGLGIGTLNCVLFELFPTWRNVWTVVTKPLFVISGIFFIVESVPREFQAILLWNPLIHAIALVRAGFYGGYDPTYVSYPYVLGIAGGTFVVGAYLLRRHASRLLEP